jgi:stress-induced-phosphoprotein 1
LRKKKIKQAREKAYLDPEKAAEAKQIGNEKFKAGDFPGAITHYTEAIVLLQLLFLDLNTLFL